jgi:hypothetical protein
MTTPDGGCNGAGRSRNRSISGSASLLRANLVERDELDALDLEHAADLARAKHLDLEQAFRTIGGFEVNVQGRVTAKLARSGWERSQYRY